MGLFLSFKACCAAVYTKYLQLLTTVQHKTISIFSISDVLKKTAMKIDS